MKLLNRDQIIGSLIKEAEKYVGVSEVGGDNKGPEVEMFQKAVDGKANRESWCMCAVQFWLKQISKEYAIEDCGIPSSEHCMTVWNKAPLDRKFKHPEPGDIVVWQYWKEGKPTASGHTGLVIKVDSDCFHTIEGNTGPGSEVIREGDGVYKKVRRLMDSSKMRVAGFIRPF
jgi:hypothetical protein